MSIPAILHPTPAVQVEVPELAPSTLELLEVIGERRGDDRSEGVGQTVDGPWCINRIGPDQPDCRSGPRDNPFYGRPITSEANYRRSDGTSVAVALGEVEVDAEQLDRYGWYLTDAASTEVDGLPALRVDGDDRTAALYLATDDGFITL